MSELLVLNGVCAGTVFFLPEVPTVVGRSPEAHLQISDPWISSMHALFERRGEEVWVVDLESRNGTFVDDARVQESRVPPGALLRFGKTEVRFEQGEGRRPVRVLEDEGTVVRYLEDLEADMERARSSAPRRDTLRSEPGPPGLARRQLAVLEEIGRVLVDAPSLDACLGRILQSVARAVRSERASLLLIDESGEMVPRATEPAGTPPALSSTVIAAAAQSRAGILTRDAQADARFSASQSIISQGIRSAMCVPIWAAHRVLGMLLFDRAPSEAFAPEDLELAAVVGHQAALAIERARFLDRARAGEERRRALQDQLPPELARLIEAHEPGEHDPLELAASEATVLRAAVAGDLLALGPSEAAARIRGALDAMAAAALAEGGATCRLAGSGLVAVFGIPTSRPDAADRAVRAARTMREACRSRELDLRAGIEHGRVLAGNIAGSGGFDLCVAGDAAEIAERLLVAARPGEILTGAGAAANSSALERAGTRDLGGNPADVFRA